jgi:tetratricopeptide (TPR) repeat protein
MNKEERGYLNEENMDEALSRFKRSLALGRKSYFDVSEFEGIVEFLLDEGDINASEIAARQGIQIHPGAVPLQLKYAQVLLSKEKYQNALKYLQLAEQVELANPDVHLMKGSAWLMLGNEYEAEKAFGKAIKHSGSEKDDILYHIGSAYIQASEIKMAINYFEQALQLNPENEMALYDLGFFSDQEGEYEKSIDYYNRYLDIDPFNFSIWFNLGISYNKAGNFEKAIEAYEFAQVLNGEFDQSLFNIGNAYANSGKYREAIAKYTEYLEFDPDNDDGWCYIGECYLNLDEHTQAEYYYQKAIKLNKENDSAWFGVGLVMWVEKKWTESIIFIKKALEIDNSNSEYWVTLAKVYNDCNRPKDAEDALAKAAELEADNTEIWLTWVDVFLKFGELKNALRILKSGLVKNDDSLLKYRMVSLLLESKHEKDAFKMLQKAMEQEFIQINYLFDIYPKALKNKRLQKLVDDFRKKNNL